MGDPANPQKREIRGTPDYVRSACDASLQRLGVDVIDLYYQPRVDANTPIEETVGAVEGSLNAEDLAALDEVAPRGAGRR